MTAAQTATAAAAGGSRGRVLAALMMTIALIALEGTIVATAVPSIVTSLGGFASFPWLFSIYLLTQAATVPLYGRFADMVGRRPVLLVGVGIFLAGSVVCGVAGSMTLLIVGRAVQGIGAGAIQPVAMTIVGDLYSVEERGRVQGFMAMVWGSSAVIGPTVGGLFADYVHWRWIFWINLPVGALAVWLLLRSYRETVQRRRHRLDVVGSLTLTVGCGLVVLGLLEGTAWGWTSAATVAVLGAGAGLLVVFVLAELRAPEPVLPLWVFRRRTLVTGNLASIAVGALILGMSTYIPVYVQGVAGTSALVAGFVLATLSVGWPLAASVSGRVYVRLGFRDTALIGSVATVSGTVLYTLLRESSPVWAIAVPGFVVGLGLGFFASSIVVAVQSVVGWERRGVVTGANMFSRTIGSALGVAAFGAVVHATLVARFAAAPPSIAAELPARVDAGGLALDPGGASPAVAAFVRTALFDATHRVFLGLVVVAVLGAVAVACMPRRTAPLTDV